MTEKSGHNIANLVKLTTVVLVVNILLVQPIILIVAATSETGSEIIIDESKPTRGNKRFINNFRNATKVSCYFGPTNECVIQFPF